MSKCQKKNEIHINITECCIEVLYVYNTRNTEEKEKLDFWYIVDRMKAI